MIYYWNQNLKKKFFILCIDSFYVTIKNNKLSKFQVSFLLFFMFQIVIYALINKKKQNGKRFKIKI